MKLLWTLDEEKYLIKHYTSLNIDEMVEVLGRSRAAIALKASKMRLTDKSRSSSKWASKVVITRRKNDTPQRKQLRSNNAKKWIKERGHPRGMLGKHHTQELKDLLKNKFKGRKLTKEWIDKILKTKMTRYGKLNFLNENTYSRTKKGWSDIGDKRYFFRSEWEKNYAYYLEWLKMNKQIKDWEFESETFWFQKIKRGVRSYLPDFKVIENNGEISFHEVKGWMDGKSKTKLKRMAKYYPHIKIVLVDETAYKQLKRQGYV